MSRERILAAARARVVFSPRGDRFSERIELLPSGASLVAVDALAEVDQVANGPTSDERLAENLAAESWPPSPPLQDVHLESRPDGMRLALMVGRAGLSHWSISCELDSGSGVLVFDVACRIKEPAVWLGSSYRLSPGLSYQGDGARGEISQGGVVLVQLIAESPAEIEWDSERHLLRIRPNLAEAEAPSASKAGFPKTIRWRYKFLMSSADKLGGK